MVRIRKNGHTWEEAEFIPARGGDRVDRFGREERGMHVFGEMGVREERTCEECYP